MPKRFSDTDKWKDPWFRKLPNDIKILWFYMLDNCDNAGIWKPDFELVEFFLSIKFNNKDVLNIFNKDKERIHPSPDNSKWFIKDFIKYQYGELNEKCKPHASVIKILKQNGLEEFIINGG